MYVDIVLVNDVRLERDGVGLLQWCPIVLNFHLYVISHQIQEQGTLKKNVIHSYLIQFELIV